MTEPSAVYPTGCQSGNVTGTFVDLARCVVVAVDLSANNLDAEMGIASFFARLPWLQELRLSNNSLRGELPTELADLPRLAHLDLRGNLFSIGVHTRRLMYACSTSIELECLGLPQD